MHFSLDRGQSLRTNFGALGKKLNNFIQIMVLMSLIEPINMVIARLMIPGPIIILIVGVFLFFYTHNHRKIVGVFFGALGSLGLLFFSGVIWASLASRFTFGFNMERGILFGLAAIEIATIIVGIVCLIKSNSVKETKTNTVASNN
jgi:hypothetical protein